MRQTYVSRTLMVTVSNLLIYAVPTFEDESQLTEVTAFVLESFRWRPVTPMGPCALIFLYIRFAERTLGFWHKATKDIVWVTFPLYISRSVGKLILPQKDHIIPAGTHVLGCHW